MTRRVRSTWIKFGGPVLARGGRFYRRRPVGAWYGRTAGSLTAAFWIFWRGERCRTWWQSGAGREADSDFLARVMADGAP